MEKQNQGIILKHTVNPIYCCSTERENVYVVRKFKPDDILEVIKLASQTLTERYNPSIFSTFYETFPEGFLVVEYNGLIVGFIVGVLTPSSCGRILMIGVDAAHRRKGLGSKLLEELLKEFTQRGVTYVELEVATGNTAAISFYRKHCFEIVECIPGFYQDGRDAYIMRRQLLPSE
ncbi:MAG TPA: N-acetyltransferase [Thermoplasmatales archaeon]|nr:N-acetyltransferase [Thermoplasmatales archaeon]